MKAVDDAKAVPTLITKAENAAPQLTQEVEAKALVESKTPIGTLAIAAVTYAVADLGLGWDQTTVALVVGLAVLVGSYVMRYVERGPISGILRRL